MAEGTGDIEEHRIALTENAARRIAVLRDQEQAENAFLRITVSGGGCSGFQYGFVVDDVSLGLLNGAEIDFVEDLMGASFQISNPNAASSCGCGNSFSIG